MQTVHPGSQRFTADAARKDLAFCQPCALAALPKHFVGSSHAAAAGGRKGNDGFSGQVIAFQKGIDDVGRDIPPALKSNPIIEGTLMFHTTLQQYSPYTRYRG